MADVDIKDLPPTPVTPPLPAPPVTAAPLVSSSPANQATAGASSTGAAAVVVLIAWGFNVAKIPIPGEVAAAMTALIGMGFHWVVITYGMKNTVG